MKVKLFYSVLSVIVLSVFVFVPGAQASLEAVHAVDNLFTAVNIGELETASALFATDAVASNALSNQFYEGSEEIDAFLEDLYHDGREYEIVQIAMSGNTVDLTVDIADRGQVWGQQRLTVEVQGSVIKSLKVIETRLTLWRISN